MADTNETIADIIAEMRYKAGTICPWQVNGGTCELCPLGHSPHGKDLGKYCSFHKLAHELEAAHKREIDEAERRANHAAIKNVSETLEAIVDVVEAWQDHLPSAIREGEVSAALDKANAALAAPPRNCDRFGSSAQARAEWYKTEVLPRVEGVVSGVEPPFVDWLFAPAAEKEGGNNANK